MKVIKWIGLVAGIVALWKIGLGSDLWVGLQLVSEGNLRTRGTYGLVVVYINWSNKI